MTTTVRPEAEDADAAPTSPDGVPPRHASLIGRISAIRRPRGRSFPLDTVLIVLGGICMPVGIVAIIIGWYGAAHTPHLYEQNDYMISGGLLGLGLVFAGGFLYFGYWMTRQIRSSETANQQIIRALGRIETRLASVPAPVTNGNGHRDSEAYAEERAAGRRAAGERRNRAQAAPLPFVATERGTLFHRPDCPVVANKENLRAVDADTPGLRPCQICAPLDGR
jgi:hypothetical protein